MPVAGRRHLVMSRRWASFIFGDRGMKTIFDKVWSAVLALVSEASLSRVERLDNRVASNPFLRSRAVVLSGSSTKTVNTQNVFSGADKPVKMSGLFVWRMICSAIFLRSRIASELKRFSRLLRSRMSAEQGRWRIFLEKPDLGKVLDASWSFWS